MSLAKEIEDLKASAQQAIERTKADVGHKDDVIAQLKAKVDELQAKVDQGTDDPAIHQALAEVRQMLDGFDPDPTFPATEQPTS